MLKVDTLDNRSISDQIPDDITRAVKKVPTDAVVFSDFRHGLFNRRTIPELVQALPPGCFRVADSQVASRWGNITDFQGFDLITPNEREARFALGDQDSGIRPLASNLYDASRCKLLILKLGERGVLAYEVSGEEKLGSKRICFQLLVGIASVAIRTRLAHLEGRNVMVENHVAELVRDIETPVR